MYLTGQQVNTETVSTASSSVVAPPAAAAAASMAMATAASQSTVTTNRSSGNKFSSTGLKIEGKPEEPWQKYLMRLVERSGMGQSSIECLPAISVATWTNSPLIEPLVAKASYRLWLHRP